MTPKPCLSQAPPAHPVYPDRLRGLAVTQSNQVWCSDITSLPVLKGRQISNTLEVSFWVEAL